MRNSLVELCALLRRHPVIEGTRNGSLIELLCDLALLRLAECLEQLDDLRLGVRHRNYIAASRDYLNEVIASKP